MHTEAEIRMVVRLLLELHGELNTTEVKGKLQEVLDFDEEDNISSKTRPGEVKITQRIGNIVSHQRDLFKIYPEGFAVDKNYNPAKFIAITGLNKNTRTDDKTLQKIIQEQTGWLKLTHYNIKSKFRRKERIVWY